MRVCECICGNMITEKNIMNHIHCVDDFKLKRSDNTGSPKLLDEMEQYAVACDRAGNGKDARCVRSWVKQLRADA